MTNITPCLSASYFNNTKIQIVDELGGDTLFSNLLILSDVKVDGQTDVFPTNPSDVFIVDGINCYIKEYYSLTEVLGDFRITSETYAAAKAAFNAVNTNLGTGAPQKILIGDFPISENSVADVPDMLSKIQRMNNSWNNIVLAKRALYNEQVGLLATDTYTSIQLAISEWVDDRRENHCETKTFWAVTDDHRSFMVDVYSEGLSENLVYDTFLANREFTIALYANTFNDLSKVLNDDNVWANWDLDLVADATGNTIKTVGINNVLLPAKLDSNSKPVYFEFTEISLVAAHYTTDLDEVGSSFTYKFKSIPNTTTSLPKLSQAHTTNPSLFLGGWDTIAYTNSTDAITDITNGTNLAEDVTGRTHLNILTGFKPKTTQNGSFGYLGSSSASNELGQFGRYGNVYLCLCGVSAFTEGTTSSGRFIDQIHNKDWVAAKIQNDICELQLQTRKIPLNGGGILLLRAILEQRLNQLQASGIIDDNFTDENGVDQLGFTISETNINDITQANRNNRSLPCIKFQYREAGAVHQTCITGIITN